MNTGGSHADLTADYASIPAEMRAVAAFLGADCLRSVEPGLLVARGPEIRAACGDRALLRALHFVAEDARVQEMAQALKDDDLKRYLKLVKKSGDSSWKLLQNLYTCSAPRRAGACPSPSPSAPTTSARGGPGASTGAASPGRYRPTSPASSSPATRPSWSASSGRAPCCPSRCGPSAPRACSKQGKRRDTVSGDKKGFKPYLGLTFLIGFGFFTMGLMDILYDTYLPIFLGDILARMNIDSNALVGFIMTLDNILAIFLIPIVSVWSDNTRTKIGRRMPYIIVLLPLSAICFSLIPYAAADSLLSLLLVVFGLNIFKQSVRGPVVALMPDTIPGEYRSEANGIINTMGAFGAIVSTVGLARLMDLDVVLPILGNTKDKIPFPIAGLLVVVAAILVFAFVREKSRDEAAAEERVPVLKSIKSIAGEKDKSALWILISLFFWFFGYQGILPFVGKLSIEIFHMSKANAALPAAAVGVAQAIFAIPSGYVAHRIGRRKAIRGSLVCLAVILSLGAFLASSAGRVPRLGPLLRLPRHHDRLRHVLDHHHHELLPHALADGDLRDDGHLHGPVLHLQPGRGHQLAADHGRPHRPGRLSGHLRLRGRVHARRLLLHGQGDEGASPRSGPAPRRPRPRAGSEAMDGLDRAAEGLLESYALTGGVNHAAGPNLPSREAVVAALIDIESLVFPGFRQDEGIDDENIGYVVGRARASRREGPRARDRAEPRVPLPPRGRELLPRRLPHRGARARARLLRGPAGAADDDHGRRGGGLPRRPRGQDRRGGHPRLPRRGGRRRPPRRALLLGGGRAPHPPHDERASARQDGHRHTPRRDHRPALSSSTTATASSSARPRSSATT